MKFFIGIDPGKKGGIAVIDEEGFLLHSEEMPLTPSGEINSSYIFFVLTEHYLNSQIFCIIEKSQAMPKQGVKSMFNFGKGYGELIAVLKIGAIPFQEITSPIWKKEYSLIKKGKKDSCEVASKLFPEKVFKTDRGRLKDGEAEACLLAEYARRNWK